MRKLFRLSPAFRGTGGQVKFISADWQELHLRLPLNLRTRNYVGTIYGGSIYGAANPIYMLMLIQILGPDYVVWDKAATVRFRKPGTEAMYSRFVLTEEEIADIKTAVAEQGAIDRDYHNVYTDRQGAKVYAEITTTVYIADKAYYKAQRNKRKE